MNTNKTALKAALIACGAILGNDMTFAGQPLEISETPTQLLARLEQDPAPAESTVVPQDKDATADKAQLDLRPAQVQRVAQNNDRVLAWAGTPAAARNAHPLIIRTTSGDPKAMADMREDLTIMSRILEKAATGGRGEEPNQAMGVPLVVTSPSAVSSMAVEGYGVIFQMNVRFPLAGPPVKAEDDTNKEPSNSSWDEARREVYGQPAGARGDSSMALGAARNFDPNKVDRLKSSLIDALKNAANVRNLSGDEMVTVVVRSGSTPPLTYVKSLREGVYQFYLGDTVVGGRRGGQPNPALQGGTPGTTSPTQASAPRFLRYDDSFGDQSLTISVKKSDIDSFAKGKLTLDEFRKRAKVLIY